MQLLVHNCWTDFRGTPDEAAFASSYLSAENEASYRPGAWGRQPERASIFDRLRNRLPSGVAGMLAKAAREAGYVVDVQDLRARPCEPDFDALAISGVSRDYQLSAIRRLFARTRGVIESPTGSGKMNIAVALAQSVPCEWLFLCHKTDVVEEAAKRYLSITGDQAKRADVSGRGGRGRSNFSVATFQQVAYHLRKRTPQAEDLVHRVQGLIVDEVHAQAAPQYLGVTMRIEGAYWRVGLTGTPFERAELDNLKTFGAIGPVVYRITTPELAEQGWVAKCVARMIPCHQKCEVGSWQSVYRDLIVGSHSRNSLIADMAAQAARPGLVFVDEVQHIDNLLPILRARGLRVRSVYGTHSISERKRAIAELERGDHDFLLTNGIFQEGVNIPTLGSVIMGAGKASGVAAIQRSGRGSRLADGKDEYELWDVYDRGQRWLAKHAAARMAAYQKEGHDVKVGWPKGSEEAV